MVDASGRADDSTKSEESAFWEDQSRPSLRLRGSLESLGNFLRKPWIVAVIVAMAVGAFVASAALPAGHAEVSSNVRTSLGPGQETLVGIGLILVAILVFDFRTVLRPVVRGGSAGVTALSVVLMLVGLGSLIAGLIKLV